MATSLINRPIVTNGLVLYLDAVNSKSYVSGLTWSDLSSSSSHLSLINGVSYTNNREMSFDGVDDFGYTLNTVAYGTGDFTWEVWVNANALSGNHYVLDHDNGVGNSGLIQWYTGTMRYYNATTGGGSVLYSTGFGNSFQTNTWYHLVVSRISGTTYLYTDGELIISDTDSHNYPTQDFLIGNYGGGGSYNWDGKISNVKIYSGKGLTQTEILQNYNALKNRFI